MNSHPPVHRGSAGRLACCMALALATANPHAFAADRPALASLVGSRVRRPSATRSGPTPVALPPSTPCELGHVDRSRVRSEFCIGCHDGTVAPGIERHRTYLDGRGPAGSHPVDVNFSFARLRSERRLRFASELPPNLVLKQGVVTCATCHDGESKLPSHLAMDNRESQMCFACHGM